MEKRAKFISKVYSLNQEFFFASAETRLRLCHLYNTAFFGSNCWKFSSPEVEKFGKTWNVNNRIMFNLPRETHSWVVEELTGGKHFIQMIYSRFVKYLSVIKNNKKPVLKALYSTVNSDVRTTTGANIRKILLHSRMDPRVVPQSRFSDWRVYAPSDSWSVPLLVSLLQLRSEAWVVNFDEEEEEYLGEEDIEFMIEAVCTG